MYNKKETELLIDALNMAINSNARMQKTKPQYESIFAQLHVDLNELKTKIMKNVTK